MAVIASPENGGWDMQRSIGLAALAFFMALAGALPASAAEEWWFGGAIDDGGYFYADATTIERLGDEASINGVIVFPRDKDGIYFFKGWVYCSDRDGFYIELAYEVGEEFRRDEFLMMKEKEAAVAAAMACSERSDWAALEFKLTAFPLDDALARAGGQ